MCVSQVCHGDGTFVTCDTGTVTRGRSFCHKIVVDDSQTAPDDSQTVPDGSQSVPDDSQIVPDDSQIVPDDSQSVP